MNDRYDRQRHIADWNQHNLSTACVIIVGMGALGNEVARTLAMAGVGKLILCDPDRIETSNLSRMLLFRPGDVGGLKVEVAASALAAMAPGIVIRTRPATLIHGLGLAELRDASLVVSCLDSRAARLQLAGRCQLVRAASIDGGTHPWGGEVRPFLVPDGACYGCTLGEEGRAISDVPWSCLDFGADTVVGAAIPSSALVGTWMGLIAVRFLMHLSVPNTILDINAVAGTTTQVQNVRDPKCPLHNPLGDVAKIDIGAEDTLHDLRSALPVDAIPLLWEPVQERVECAQCRFEESRWELPGLSVCPRCGTTLRPRTTLELTHAPGELRLSHFGVPPREILTVRTSGGLRWVELSS